MAGYGSELSKVISEGSFQVPTFIRLSVYSVKEPATETLTVCLSICSMKEYATDYVPFHLCDGVSECIKAVRLQIRRGARVIKVAASGGVLSLIDDPQIQQFSDKESWRLLSRKLDDQTLASLLTVMARRASWQLYAPAAAPSSMGVTWIKKPST